MRAHFTFVTTPLIICSTFPCLGTVIIDTSHCSMQTATNSTHCWTISKYVHAPTRSHPFFYLGIAAFHGSSSETSIDASAVFCHYPLWVAHGYRSIFVCYWMHRRSIASIWKIIMIIKWTPQQVARLAGQSGSICTFLLKQN